MSKRAKLNPYKVWLARRWYFRSRLTQQEIADLLGVTRENISLLLNGYTWRWVGDEMPGLEGS